MPSYFLSAAPAASFLDDMPHKYRATRTPKTTSSVFGAVVERSERRRYDKMGVEVGVNAGVVPRLGGAASGVGTEGKDRGSRSKHPTPSLAAPASTPGQEPAISQSPQHVTQDGTDGTHDQSSWALHNMGPKRKRSSKDSNGSKRARSKLADAAVAEVGPETTIGKLSKAVVRVDGGDEGARWTLSPAWRSALERITSTEGYGYAQDFCYRARFPDFTVSLRRNQDVGEEIGGKVEIPASYRRSKQLRSLLDGTYEYVQSVEPAIICLQVSRRVYLTELAANYEAERSLARKKGEQTAKVCILASSSQRRSSRRAKSL
ncbi:hypothetical protein BKA65DRAFT_543540 [Rhexocercosporidium sp. MPI-PUGE-AT-0058]|nr:hypothetical protein BKA65DRAFT_543540 [Rhexocercosporidium sp. MPI-PUGE-AT-0058]